MFQNFNRYSRRIMWARVAHSNNNPDIIAHYYLECIEVVEGICIDSLISFVMVSNYNRVATVTKKLK